MALDNDKNNDGVPDEQVRDDSVREENEQERVARESREAHEASALNRSAPDPASRDLWQSANVSTDGNGPLVEDVTPIFAQARAQALGNPLTADDDDDALEVDLADSARRAQEEADRLRESTGWVAQTGEAAGKYDDPTLEHQVPADNFNKAPEVAEGERTVDDARTEDPSAKGNVYTDGSTINPTGPNGTQVSNRDKEDQLRDDQNGGATAVNAESTSADTNNTEANPQESTPEAPTSNTGDDANKDTTHDDLVSDTAGEQGGLDATSADGATPKRTSARRKS